MARALLIVFLLTLTVPMQAWAEQPIDIGSQLELFVDDHLIDEMDGVELRLHQPVKAPTPESPLVANRHMLTIIADSDERGELYRAYWRSSDRAYTGETYTGHPGETVEYAESRDGIEWDYPVLGFHDVSGTTENNVLLAKRPPFLTNFMPFLDTRPGVDPNERYKAVAGYPGKGDKRELRGEELDGRGLHAFVSPDGIQWTDRGEVIPYQPGWRHAFDSPNVAFWSEAEQLYVCYFRTWTRPERLRSISRTTSPDFINWSKPVEMKPNRPGEHLYTSGTQPYPRAPHIYIALPTRFMPDRGDAPGYDLKDVNATDILFMTTRAGSETYDRAFTEAFIRPGLDPKRWGNRGNFVGQNVVQTSPEELSIYHRSGHRYVLRTDGFVSVHAGSEPGELLTRPLVFDGSELVVNLSTSVAGALRVEVQDAKGKPIPGFTLGDSVPLYGDAIEMPVTWADGGDVSSLAGQPVRLRFVLNEGDLYSMRFR